MVKFVVLLFILLSQCVSYAQTDNIKDMYQKIKTVSLSEQRKLIDRAFSEFLNVCSNDSMKIANIEIHWNIADTTYEPFWQKYFDEYVEPSLGQFPFYYKETFDTILLKKYFKLTQCNTDGEFGESYHFGLQYCYLLNKNLFARQVRAIRRSEFRESIFQGLSTGIQASFAIEERIETRRQKLVNREIKEARLLLIK